MVRKDMEHLVGKLCSMHLAVTVVVAHHYHLQRVISQAGVDRAWLSPAFYREIADWRKFAYQRASQPTHLDKIVCHEPTHMGF